MIVGDHNTPMVNTNSQVFPQDTVTADRTLALLMKNPQINTHANQQNGMPDQQNTISLFNEFLLPQHQSSSPVISNLLQYINPAVFIQRNGRLPPILNGACPARPTWEDQYKTVMCEAKLLFDECPYGENCRFAHNYNELRTIKPQPRNSRKYKTRLCEKYNRKQICPYGENCFFIHLDPNNPNNQEFFDLCYRMSQIDPQFSVNALDSMHRSLWVLLAFSTNRIQLHKMVCLGSVDCETLLRTLSHIRLHMLARFLNESIKRSSIGFEYERYSAFIPIATANDGASPESERI
uniref:C3H1-type domain-containing protein n=1 Tax=Acrobeloides nanus TaxID=290746 RepID=A0A914EKE9_9BILA